jgi:hypothetical protein
MSYILNLDAKFKMGGRKIAKITEQEFHNEIKKFFKKYPDIWPEPDGTSFDTSLDRFIPAVAGLGVGYEGIDCQIRKDFKGVEVDLENQEMLGKIRFTPSGCPYVVGYVGGDWENPVVFMIYFDGNEMRAYVPKCGNTWRTYKKDDGKTGKIALGNLDDDDDWVYKDLLRTGQIQKGHSKSDLISDVEFEIDLCIGEFLARVGESNP